MIIIIKNFVFCVLIQHQNNKLYIGLYKRINKLSKQPKLMHSKDFKGFKGYTFQNEQ